jgi:poly(ADP-ribose) glycohydrolase
VLEPDYDRDDAARSIWPRRTMLFMDALELDMLGTEDQVPDLLPGHVGRELRKAYTAFSSISSREERYTEVLTGLWGCGAFGGDWQIKTIIQWCAAAMASVSLHFVCSGDQQDVFATTLDEFTRLGIVGGWCVGDVVRALLVLNTDSSDARRVFTHLKSVLSSS